jgi:hypothetical protein
MNGLQGTDWGNKAGLKQASAAAGDRNLNSVTGVVSATVLATNAPRYCMG